MNFLRLFPIIFILLGLHLCAMDGRENTAQKVFYEGGSTAQLQMGRYLGSTHPEVYAWLLELLFNRPMRSVKFGGYQSGEGLGEAGSERFTCYVGEETFGFNKGNGARKFGLQLKEMYPAMSMIEYDRDGNSVAVISTEGTHHFMEDRDSHCRMELPHPHLARPPTWGINEESVACFSENEHMIWIWDIQTFRLVHAAIDSLSLVQQNFIISLAHINNQYHQPLFISSGTSAHATFETLSPCLRQLLLQNNCVQLNNSLIGGTWQAISNFLQNISFH